MGRGVIFNPKIHIADFGNFKQGFLSMKLIQKSNFRVQGMFFFNNCIDKNQNKTYFEEGTSESPQDETDEFSEKCQTAFDPHPSKPSKIGVTIYGCI